MKKFDYAVEHYCNYASPDDPMKITYSFQAMRTDLVQKSLQSWELVSVVPHIGGELIAVFKRPQEAIAPTLEKKPEIVGLPAAKPEKKPRPVLFPKDYSKGCAHGGPLPTGARCSLCEG